jgi:hypothetical protein
LYVRQEKRVHDRDQKGFGRRAIEQLNLCGKDRISVCVGLMQNVHVKLANTEQPIG